jgi:glycine cleavage system transcriptional repressor
MSERKHVLVTAVGADRTGIVERLTRAIVDASANVEQSRMARLGGEFAAFLLVSAPAARTEALSAALAKLADGTLSVSTRTLGDRSKILEGYVPYALEVNGADHEGIIHEFCRLLAAQGVNIAEMETDVRNSPVSGTPMFAMNATLEVPGSVSVKALKSLLEGIADKMVVDYHLRVEA